MSKTYKTEYQDRQPVLEAQRIMSTGEIKIMSNIERKGDLALAPRNVVRYTKMKIGSKLRLSVPSAKVRG